jgi:hypothetical protein
MTKTTSIIATILGLTLIRASDAGAQTSGPAAGNMFASVNLGAQVQTRTFSNSSSFDLFGETATVSANQTVGRGFVFDISGGRRFGHNLAVAVGLWTFNGSGTAATTAALPDPLLFGQPITVNSTASGLKQRDVGVNFQIGWIAAVTDRINIGVFGGPSVIHVKQDIGTITVAPGTQNATASVNTESKTTGKAGSVGVDVSYRLTNRYGVGGFIRYAGGEVDLPSSPKLKVGGIQLGAGARIRF